MTKKEIIMQAALAEFAKQGFDRASIEEIARQAKVAKGTVFYHFQSKENLFNTILSAGKDRFEQQVFSSISTLTDPIEQVEAIIKVEASFIKKFRNFFQVYMSDFLKESHRLPSIEKVINHGKKQGVFREELDSSLIATTIFWITAITVLNKQNGDVKNLILNGLLKK